MPLIRKIATMVLVWATASSTLLASAPYYVCACPNGMIRTQVEAVAPSGSCCAANCCVGGSKEKSCCDAAKKTPASKSKIVKVSVDQSASISHIPCQKTVVQSEQGSLGAVEVRADETHQLIASLPACLPGFHAP